MPKIYVEINSAIDFNIVVYDDPVSEIFFKQHQEISSLTSNGIQAQLMDTTKYTINYFIDLIDTAKAQDIIDWSRYTIQPGVEHYLTNQKQFNSMHKDLEVIVGIEKYRNFGTEQKNVLDELHCCLHSLESDSAPLNYKFTPRGFLNFHYYVDYELAPIPAPIKFKRTIEPGEIHLDYCYVGRDPFFCMMAQDNDKLTQTCKIIDKISINWKLHLMPTVGDRWGPPPWPNNVDDALSQWYHAHKIDMDQLGYSLDKILDHTGFCTVGCIDDTSKLHYLRHTPNIIITNYGLIS